MPDPLIAELRDLAAKARARADEHRRKADEFEHTAANLESQAATLEEGGFPSTVSTALHEPRRKSTVNTMLTAEHRIAISRSKDDAAEPPFLKALRRRGYTLRSLATALDISPGLISKHRSGNRPIPKDRAARIEELTGWPADARHWPKIS